MRPGRWLAIVVAVAALLLSAFAAPSLAAKSRQQAPPGKTTPSTPEPATPTKGLRSAWLAAPAGTTTTLDGVYKTLAVSPRPGQTLTRTDIDVLEVDAKE